MVDSESDCPRASDAQISRALRNAVAKCFRTEDFESLTHRRIREKVAIQLKLPDDFFKDNAKWKAKSKDIINREVEKLEAANPQSSPQPKKKSAPAEAHLEDEPEASRPGEGQVTGRKRKSPALKEKPRKRQKKSPIEDSDDANLSDALSSKSVSRDGTPAELKISNDSEEYDLGESKRKEITKAQTASPMAPKQPEDVASESEMSVVIDDTPPPKRKHQKSGSKEPPKSNPVKTSKTKAELSNQASDPQEDEIKRLQSWLVKCGLRKVWSKELASCSGAREKIAHLKKSLKDVGMTGRFSEEKAKQIKEEREFKADLEAIQEGNKQWGQSDNDESGDEDDGRPKRRIARGLKELQQFDDDEESD